MFKGGKHQPLVSVGNYANGHKSGRHVLTCTTAAHGAPPRYATTTPSKTKEEDKGGGFDKGDGFASNMYSHVKQLLQFKWEKPKWSIVYDTQGNVLQQEQRITATVEDTSHFSMSPDIGDIGDIGGRKIKVVVTSQTLGIQIETINGELVLTQKQSANASSPGICQEIVKANVPCGAVLDSINGIKVVDVKNVKKILRTSTRPTTFVFNVKNYTIKAHSNEWAFIIYILILKQLFFYISLIYRTILIDIK